MHQVIVAIYVVKVGNGAQAVAPTSAERLCI